MKFSVERIVGGTGAQKEVAETYLREVFEHQDRALLTGLEVEKSEEVLRDIVLANQITTTILAEYGIQKEDISPDNIHVIKKDMWPERLEGTAALFNFTHQGIAVRDDQPEIGLLHDLMHEIFHFKSYLAGQITSHGKLSDYRVGVEVTSRDGEQTMLKGINEAITEELVYRAAQTPLYKETVRTELERIRRDMEHHADAVTEDGSALFTNQTYYVEVGEEQEDGTSLVHTKAYEYQKEREALKLLTEKLYQRDPTAFKNADEVFALFVKSAFSGNLLKIGRLIEESFGTGTLRKVAENNSGEKLLTLVQTL